MDTIKSTLAILTVTCVLATGMPAIDAAHYNPESKWNPAPDQYDEFPYGRGYPYGRGFRDYRDYRDNRENYDRNFNPYPYEQPPPPPSAFDRARAKHQQHSEYMYYRYAPRDY